MWKFLLVNLLLEICLSFVLNKERILHTVRIQTSYITGTLEHNGIRRWKKMQFNSLRSPEEQKLIAVLRKTKEI